MITFLIVLYTGSIVDSWGWKWGTDIYAAVWAFVILVVANIASYPGSYSDWRIYCLAFFNSFLVAASAGKLRDKSLYEAERRKQKLVEKESADQGFINAKASDTSQSEAT